MAHHHSQRQQIDSLPPGTGTDSANIPPSFDPDLANPPSQPPTTVGDADSAKAAKSPPTTDPSIPSTPTEPSTPSTPSATPSTPTTPTTPTTDPSNPASSSSSAKPLPQPPPDQPPSPASPPSPPSSAEHSKASGAPTHDAPAPVDSPSPTSASPASAPSQPPQTPADTNPAPISSASVASPSPSPVPSKHVDSSGSTQSDLPPPNQAVGGAISPSQIDQSIAVKASDATSSPSRVAHTPQPQQNSRPDSGGTGSNVGTIMGVLVAAVIGALILVGVLGFIKRKRRERQSQAEFHQDIFQEKNSFDPDMDRKSLGSGSLRMPMSPDGRTGFNGRPTDGIYGPRPPSIIERHQQQTSPPAPMPSYQPGQVVNYGYHPNQQQQQQQHLQQPFNLHRPKPPTYHSPYPEHPGSGLAYAGSVNHHYQQQNIERSVSPRSIPYDHNNLTLDVSHLDPSQHNNRYDYQGMNATDNIPMQNMTSYNSAPAGEQQHQSSYPTHHPTNDPQSNPNYQQQVDQLDFFGQPSPALTMVGPMTTDWSDQQTKCSPSEKQFPKSYIPEGEEGGDHRVTESPDDLRSGTPVNPNLQQSYLDCETTIFDRPSAMTTNNGDGGDHWKLECPQTSSPLGEIFIDHSFLDNHPHFDPTTQQHKDLLPPASTTKALQVRNA
ncbi:hypothetical protein MJO28_002806 [Puccinia striiformis f. sp. tritici]|uniref:Uncharacterized protein n=1 Tax=Puccinia striiformis f. sp. tritici TaxID=168172 RepID=A0ACC0EUE1_9BASI|nr:hypothetical protein Pst134EB_006311 [Puccinia striiformis f. sp. tritici]KAI7959015.1 hypothetical protein MJO28_002806 [Puccinia striiformis f. sp. tritici]